LKLIDITCIIINYTQWLYVQNVLWNFKLNYKQLKYSNIIWNNSIPNYYYLYNVCDLFLAKINLSYYYNQKKIYF